MQSAAPELRQPRKQGNSDIAKQAEPATTMARGETYQAAAAALDEDTREYLSEDEGEDFSFLNSPRTGGT